MNTASKVFRIAIAIVIAVILLSTVLISASNEAEVKVFLHVPGAKGSVTNPAFKGWLELNACRYRLPGVPAPDDILKTPPAQKRGMFIEKDLENAIASFSKWTGQADTALKNALNKKKNFSIWEMAIYSPNQQVIMNILFKSVVIKGISQREGKLYVTFSFRRAVWKYNPPSKN